MLTIFFYIKRERERERERDSEFTQGFAWKMGAMATFALIGFFPFSFASQKRHSGPFGYK